MAIGIVGVLLILLSIILLMPDRSGRYHLREFEKIKANFNTYRPSIADRVMGIQDNMSKYRFHLRKLLELRVVEHKEFVFTRVPYTREASIRIWTSATDSFPDPVMLTATYYAPNAPGYGVMPYVLDVWDFPSNMQAWASFYATNNVEQ